MQHNMHRYSTYRLVSSPGEVIAASSEHLFIQSSFIPCRSTTRYTEIVCIHIVTAIPVDSLGFTLVNKNGFLGPVQIIAFNVFTKTSVTHVPSTIETHTHPHMLRKLERS
ncbi:uncharacterized protein LOC114240530 [Bombyx mandarina]|uniref:Uncharacterized protein LOC114240530 n=1 Tax=Bombyx mandarina TaxID=7092 RepID=A0A6J2JBN4_BOMMA|nr:uncharacterized protein LOC114240530 [Bombyx mandarina]